ncbi:phage tail sheath family protein [Megalodesulfovibrio paquesii]
MATLGYKHGVYTQEVPTAVLPARKVEAGIAVVVGTAPVHRAADGVHVNAPKLCYSYAEAVAALGWLDGRQTRYGLTEYAYVTFALYNVGPVIFVNVFDPAVHRQVLDAPVAQVVSAAGTLQLAHDDLIPGSLVIKSQDGATTYAAGTDYMVDEATGLVSLLEGGAIAAGATVSVAAYAWADPSAVTAQDIIGGIDGVTGAREGLELVEAIFPMFRLVPGSICAPGYSHLPEVAAVMAAKAGSINGHFKAVAVLDMDAQTLTRYTDVPAAKELASLADPQQICCWPKVALGGTVYHLSCHLAATMARVDVEHGDIPYKSPSNELLRMDAAVAGPAGAEEPVWLGPDQANYLNGQGIVTALNFTGGWRSWGNRTACYPFSTDPKDAFIPLRRMTNWKSNQLVLTWWQKVDYPITKRLIETIVDSENIALNGLAAREIILGGRLEFREEENPVTDLLDGIIRFHLMWMPPPPARQIEFLVELDPSYFETLFV